MKFYPIKSFIKKGRICVLEISEDDAGINVYACYVDDEKQVVDTIKNEIEKMVDGAKYTTEVDFPEVSAEFKNGKYTFKIIGTVSKDICKQVTDAFGSEE